MKNFRSRIASLGRHFAPPVVPPLMLTTTSRELAPEQRAAKAEAERSGRVVVTVYRPDRKVPS